MSRESSDKTGKASRKGMGGRRRNQGKRRKFRTDVRVATFLEAASLGDVERLLFLLREGLKPDASDQEGRTALYVAARSGRISAVRVLIEAKADCNVLVEHDPEISRLRPWSVPRGPRELTSTVRLDRGVVAAVVSPITPITRAQRRADDAGGFNVTPLMAASINGNAEVVRSLAAAGADVNATGWKGRTAIILTVIFRHPEVVQALVDAGADVNFKDEEGVSALIAATENEDEEVATVLAKAGAKEPNIKSIALVAAVESGDLERLHFLLSTDVNVNEQDVFGATALTRAGMFGHLKIAELLLESGADVNLKDRAGFTPLIAAAYYGKPQLVHLFARTGADLNQVHLGSTALDYAKSFGHSDIARFLVGVGASRKESIHDAVAACSAERVRELIKRGTPLEEPGDSGETPLALACRNGDLEIVQILLKAGARPERGGSAVPIGDAAANGQLKVVQELIKAGANVNTAGESRNTPLMRAAEAGHLDVVKALIKAGASARARNANGETALGLAGSNGHEPVVDLLLPLVSASERRQVQKDLRPGVESKARPEDAVATDLILHAAQGNLDGVRSCLESGTEVNSVDEQGETALHKAAWWGHGDVVQALIEAGANVNARGSDGWTPLMGASRMGHADVIRALAHAGADVDAKDQHGSTAAQIAASLGHRSAVEALIDAGAKDAPSQMAEVENIERKLEEEVTGFANFVSERIGDSGLADAVRTLVERSPAASEGDKSAH